MIVNFFSQPYLLYLYSIDKYKASGAAQVTLRAKDSLTLIFAARIARSTSKMSTPYMEHDATI
jgi:hypothetical protein